MYTSELTLEKVNEFFEELKSNEDNYLVFGCDTKVLGGCVDLYYPAVGYCKKKLRFVEIVEEQNSMGWVVRVKIRTDGYATHSYHRSLSLGVFVSEEKVKKFLMDMKNIKLRGIYIKTAKPR